MKCHSLLCVDIDAPEGLNFQQHWKHFWYSLKNKESLTEGYINSQRNRAALLKYEPRILNS